MTPTFEHLAGAAWKAHVDGVGIFIDDQGGQPEPTQLAVALRLADNISAIRAQGAAYLDLFVDRRRACGNEKEEWWLDEIEMRGMQKANPRLSLFFVLEGDDGGQWTVELRVSPDRFHPVRFERRQG